MTARDEGIRELALPDLERRMANMVRDGVIFAVDLPGKRVRVKSGNIETTWLPWPAGRAGPGKRRWDPPEVGEQVTMISLSGDLRQARVIPGIYQDAYDAPSADGNKDMTVYGDGTVIEYDRGSSTLSATLNPAGSIVLNVGSTTLILRNGQATLVADDVVVQAPQSTFTGNVTVEGTLTYGNGLAGTAGSGGNTIHGGLTMEGGSVTHDGKNIGSTHTHGGVQTGGGNTGGPT